MEQPCQMALGLGAHGFLELSRYRGRWMGWGGQHSTGTALPLPCLLQPQPSLRLLLPSQLLCSTPAAPGPPEFQVPETSCSCFLWKSIVVCKPEILVSMLYSAMLMRIKSIHEKYLLSMFIIYFSNITILDSGFFFSPNTLSIL